MSIGSIRRGFGGSWEASYSAWGLGGFVVNSVKPSPQRTRRLRMVFQEPVRFECVHAGLQGPPARMTRSMSYSSCATWTTSDTLARNMAALPLPEIWLFYPGLPVVPVKDE